MYTKTSFMNTLAMICIGFAILSTQGCSLVQYSPTMNCEHIIYERTGDTAQVLADGCKV